MQYSSGLQRYFNEHIHLPNTFFDNPLRFVKHALMEKGDLMAKAYNYVELGYEDLGDVIHYQPDDFQVMSGDTEGRVCILMRPPEPTQALQCKLMGCSIQHDGSNPIWRTIELTEEGALLLCGWTKEHAHMILDEVGATPEDFVPRMIQELATAVEFDLAAFRAQVEQKSTCKQ